MLTYYMLKTNEHSYSKDLALAASGLQLNETVIEEAYAPQADILRLCGIRCIPSFVAIHEDENGKLTCIHEASQANELLGFEALAQEKLSAFLGE